MKEIIKAWLKMDEKERDSILLNEIAMLYEEVDRLKQIIENMTSDNAQS